MRLRRNRRFPDSLGMYAAAAGLPELLATSIDEAERLPSLAAARPGAVVICGSGPAGIAAEIVGAALTPTIGVPLVLVPTGAVPPFVGPESLVFVVSFSGDDPGSLDAADESLRRGAHLVAVTGGGELARLAAQAGEPVVTLPAVPRARGALLAVVAAVFVGLERAGLVEHARSTLEAAHRQAASRRDALVAADGGIAAELARRIGRTFPFLCGASGLGAVAARWWQAEIAANARTLAMTASAPELLWDAIAAFGQGGDVTRQILTLVELRSDFEPARAAAAFVAIDELLTEVVAGRLVVHAEGETLLAQLVDLVVVGEFVSLHLGLNAGLDPGPAPAIDDATETSGARRAARPNRPR